MIVKFKDLKTLREKLKSKKIVFAGGTFDLLHNGHVKYLAKLKSMGNIVVIAISSDIRVKQRKGPSRPILNQSERLTLIDSIKYVDYSLIAPDYIKNGIYPTIQVANELKPDIFVAIEKKWLKSAKKINSTSRIIKKILRNYK